MYRLLASVHAGEPVQQGDASLDGPHGRRDALLTKHGLRDVRFDEMAKYAFARETPVWDELGPPYQVAGEWRAAYAHGHSLPLTEAERIELQARHSGENHAREDSPTEPQQPATEPEEHP
jgi:hypothetical protein